MRYVQNKQVKAVQPYQHPDNINFKMAVYNAWQNTGGATANSHYPHRLLHGLTFRFDFRSPFENSRQARLRFVEPISIKFDTFPDYAIYEVIPFIWDCWPKYFENTCQYFIKHQVRTAFFTSSQTAEKMKKRFPSMNIFYIPEGIDTTLYQKGKLLKDRNIDLLEYGRKNDMVVKYNLPNTINHLYSKKGEKLFVTNKDLFSALANTRITIALTRKDTQPELAGDIDTLTQRYWESMLSRIIMVGRAPQELIELIGYNPVIELDKKYPNEQILEMLKNIEKYQPLVDKNRETALRFGDWKIRTKQVMAKLKESGYNI